MDEEDWRQILFDFRWSRTARGHWLVRFGHQKLVFLCLRQVTNLLQNAASASSKRARGNLELARRLVVFLEEQFGRLATPAEHEARESSKGSENPPQERFNASQQKNSLFAICELLNSIIVAPHQSNKVRREFLQLKCQAVSTLTVILVITNAQVYYKKLLSSFVRLLLGIVARVRAQSDQQLRLVACESLKLLEHEYPDYTFVVPKHILSHCESETTFALQGYLCLLAATTSKLVRKVERSRALAGPGEIEEVEETSNHHSNEIRQATLMLLDKLEVLSPAGVVGISKDFLVLANSAKIGQQDLWRSFYSVFHMMNPLILSQILLSCVKAGYSVSKADYLDVTHALVTRTTTSSFGLEPFQIRQLVAKALSNLNNASLGTSKSESEDVQRALLGFVESLFPSPRDTKLVVSSKMYACLKICVLLERCSVGSSGEEVKEERALHLSKRLERFWTEVQQAKRSSQLVKPLFNAVKDFLNGKPGSLAVDLACGIAAYCFDKHPEVFASCLDHHLSRIIEADCDSHHHKYFLEAVNGLFSKWLPDDYKFVGGDMHLLHHYFSCIDKLFSMSTFSPKLLLSVLLYYVRCSVPRKDSGRSNASTWVILETVLSLVRSVLKHHAINVRDMLEMLNELLRTVKDYADDPDTVDQCCFYLSLINSLDVAKLCLLMFGDDDANKNSRIAIEKPKDVKRNLFSDGDQAQDRLVTAFRIVMKPCFECEVVFDEGAVSKELFGLEASFEVCANSGGDVAIEDVLVPYVTSGTTVAVDCQVLRPLPVVVNPKVRFSDAEGNSYSGRCPSISIGIEHFCRMASDGPGLPWARTPSIKTCKTLKIAADSCGNWKQFEVEQGRLLICLPPKFHVQLVITPERGGESHVHIQTDFWPCLEYIDDYLEDLFTKPPVCVL
ncbi:hypothetical protein HOP50_13g68240 [Chloropicon primus]|uniref:AP5B1 C-terminal domain-containing protein n=2 Tax=Chloropicon primus TaxID=1764295 RepID=A0A5B8MU29_9CHLO|nr:hypothetical protein A3770_13p68060 [Chloropicon primus]UPR03495.1 hypothetical protein HOP50_13g68240 [Chloropicon primus]|eukprot:QDZ24288.1 hypothetical protein A3770_13p68060 [Chloropicon primus]